MKSVKVFLLIIVLSMPAWAQIPAQVNDPWYSTFSIIAFDPATKEFGVGVQ